MIKLKVGRMLVLFFFSYLCADGDYGGNDDTMTMMGAVTLKDDLREGFLGNRQAS